jgi:CDP-diacylglycerol--serine O-phosphatidyltransferase
MRQLPNLLTLLNLLSGCIGIVALATDNFELAGLCIIASSVFDFFDGFAARLLKSYSPLGKQLDSLADMVSFGVIPGMIMFRLFQHSHPMGIFENPEIMMAGSYFMFVITLFSCLRLARFNIDTRQSDHFIGLPVPANTLFIASLPFIIQKDQFGMRDILLNPHVLLIIAIASAWIMVANLPLIALKFKSYDWASNKGQWILIILAIGCFFTLTYAALPMIIIFYVILSKIFPPKTISNA